jgi:hypothetical protein
VIPLLHLRAPDESRHSWAVRERGNTVRVVVTQIGGDRWYVGVEQLTGAGWTHTPGFASSHASLKSALGRAETIYRDIADGGAA